MATTAEFNMVYLLLHSYLHVFNEGVGLRQEMEYYFVLCMVHKFSASRANKFERKSSKVQDVLDDLGLSKFAAAMMWVMGYVFGLEKERMIAEPSEKDGRLLLAEIMDGGNFGKGHAMTSGQQRNGTARVMHNLWHNIKLWRFGYTEVLCTLFWRLWHYFWMKKRGFR